MYEKIIKQIIDASNNHSLTFFVGAGVSGLSNAPDWKSLIDLICDELKIKRKNKYSSDEYLSIPQKFYYALGEDDKKYSEFIKNAIYKTTLKPNRIHQMMMQLSPVSFMTTNYDNLIEEAAISCCKTYKPIAEDREVPDIKGERFVLKVHGDFEHKNFVLKEEDYLNYEDHFKLISTVMKSVFSTNTVVFIGYSLNDYNIKLILNWEKVLLKEKFKPVFISTALSPLSKEDILYQKSRGIEVIEFCKLCDTRGISENDYMPRYEGVMSAILNARNADLNKMNDDEAFAILYEKLAPLDKLAALRISDISRILGYECPITDNGIISVRPSVTIFNKYIQIASQINYHDVNISNTDEKKFKLITRVLGKARIQQIIDLRNNVSTPIKSEQSFADTYCLRLDYTYMGNYCKNEFVDIDSRCRQAFYFTRLYKYDKAFFSYAKIAKDAYSSSNYLVFYIAEINCINLKKVIEKVNNYYGMVFDINAAREYLIFDNEETLFDTLPLEFRDKYPTLRDLSTNTLLYKYNFDAAQDAKKLNDSIESYSLEFGLTSSGKVTCKINEYLHFLLGNGICTDVFWEYQIAVRDLMSTLVRKYVSQEKKSLNNTLMPDMGQVNIYFDLLDFYCFITFFSKKELEKLFRRWNCSQILFNDMDVIEKGISNVFRYYERFIRYDGSQYERNSWQRMIVSCIIMTKYMDTSDELLERICKFILKNRLEEFGIDDIILYIDKQIYSHKVYNKVIREQIEKTLIDIIDTRIDSLIQGKDISMFSKRVDINYPNLADYLDVSSEKYTSRRLSKRVSEIIDKDIKVMQREIVEHYIPIISIKQKRKTIDWIETDLSLNFSFNLFSLLLSCDKKRAFKYVEELKRYFRKKLVKTDKLRPISGVVSYPIHNEYEELIKVGIWSFSRDLPKEAFVEFTGISDEFDFFIEYGKFDFNRFNVSWLLQYNNILLKRIVKNINVKRKIQCKIVTALKSKTIRESESKKLQELMIMYFSETV